MTDDTRKTSEPKEQSDAKLEPDNKKVSEAKASETGGPKGPEPTRYGDWEKKGRCIDF